MSDATNAYRAARDRLLALRELDLAEAVRSFAWPDLGPSFNWAVDWFDVIAAEHPDRDALVVAYDDAPAVRRTFAEMSANSSRIAAWLVSLGLSRGEAVILMLDNQVELWECMLAIMKAGAVIMPTTTALGAAEIPERAERGGVRAVICNPADTRKFDALDAGVVRVSTGPVQGWNNLADAYVDDVAPLPHPGTRPEDPLLLYFTSGTTSRPKLVQHTQVSYPMGHMTTAFWIGLQPGDVHLNISSPGWAKHAWSCFFAPWIAEATIVVYNYSRMDAVRLRDTLCEHGVSTFCAPPTVWRMLINADLGAKPEALREAVAAGEPLNPEVIRQVESNWGLVIRDGFGQTETSVQVANPPGQPVKPGSMGRPLPGVPVALVDPVTGTPVTGVGEGEICLDLAQRPLCLMTGYLDDPERNDEAMAGGYYHTGDVAARDEDGYLFYIGRTDDVFKASDYKISPFELESALIEHPAVAEAAVVPSPDPVRLAVPKAYVALAPGFEPDAATAFEILKFARHRLSPFQRIRRLEFVDLPKTISGKIRRVELRGREADLADTGGAQDFRDDQFPELRQEERDSVNT